MDVTAATQLPDYLSSAAVSGRSVSRLLAHPTDADQANVTVRQDLAVAVGPEGGFTVEEIAIAKQHDWQTISLGPRILRIETAAIAIVAKAVG